MNDLCYVRRWTVVGCLLSRECAGESPSIIFNEFLFKSLKAKYLSSQLTTKRLEIAALCMVCAVLSVFVRVVLLPVLINLYYFNTARPQFYAI